MGQPGNIETFNDLIRAHRDRISEYQNATLRLRPQESGLSSTFSEIIRESEQCIADLTAQITPEGEVPADRTSFEGTLYKIWIDLKLTLSAHPNYSLLDICEKGEDAMVSCYREALNHPGTLTPDDIRLLESQQEIVTKTHDMIKAKRDQYHELVKNNQII